jgi:hypothetical protein
MSVDIHPEHLCVAVDRMGWAELERTARTVLAAFSLVAEAPGAHVRETSTARGRAGSTVPRATPVCRCGCPSQHDHWVRVLGEARDADVARAAESADGTPQVPEPRRFRSAVFRAAEDLHGVSHAVRRDVRRESAHGPELADFVCERYQGVPADRAAVLETRRRGQGLVTAAAIRRIRSRNGHGMELGEPHPPDEEIADQVLTFHRMGQSDREIARAMDLGRKAVSEILAGRRSDLADDDGVEVRGRGASR